MHAGTVKAVKTNQSLQKAFHIIERMAETHGPMRLQDIAHFVKLPVSTTLRFINTLMQLGYVSQDLETQRYALTFKICRVGEQIRAGHRLTDLVHPFLVSLTEKIGESSCMAVEEADEVVYVDVVEGPMSILQTLQRIGKRAPLHSTGVGKSLLLNYNSNEIREKIKKRGLPKLTDKTITSIEKFLAEIDKVRRQGYALDNEECETGVRCIAAPVRDYTGKIVCSISLSGPSSRFDEEKADTAVASIKKISAEISHHLGFAEGQ